MPHHERIEFIVYGNPIPKARARVANGHAFTPARTVAWEQEIRLRCPAKELRGELCIVLRFYRDSRKRCDIDNLCKSVFDALNGKAWKDDCQIIELGAFKSYDPTDPRVEIEIEEVNPS